MYVLHSRKLESTFEIPRRPKMCRLSSTISRLVDAQRLAARAGRLSSWRPEQIIWEEQAIELARCCASLALTLLKVKGALSSGRAPCRGDGDEVVVEEVEGADRLHVSLATASPASDLIPADLGSDFVSERYFSARQSPCPSPARVRSNCVKRIGRSPASSPLKAARSPLKTLSSHQHAVNLFDAQLSVDQIDEQSFADPLHEQFVADQMNEQPFDEQSAEHLDEQSLCEIDAKIGEDIVEPLVEQSVQLCDEHSEIHSEVYFYLTRPIVSHVTVRPSYISPKSFF